MILILLCATIVSQILISTHTEHPLETIVLCIAKDTDHIHRCLLSTSCISPSLREKQQIVRLGLGVKAENQEVLIVMQSGEGETICALVVTEGWIDVASVNYDYPVFLRIVGR